MSRFPTRSWPPREPPHRRNGKIRAREVRVLDEEKKPLGVMALSDALRLAQQKGLDLVEVAATANPPVCRIVDYGKFRYEQSKNEKHSQKAGDKLKEIQLSAVIDPHDFQTKVSHAVEFLSSEIKVRIKLRFKGRQKAHKEFGFDVVNRFVQAVAAYGHADSPPKMLGDRDLNVLLTPLPREKRGKPPVPPGQRSAKDSPAPNEGGSASGRNPGTEPRPPGGRAGGQP